MRSRYREELQGKLGARDQNNGEHQVRISNVENLPVKRATLSTE